MESLTGPNAQTEAEPKPNKRTSPIERANIGKAELEKINSWIRQLEDSSKGFMALTKSDLVNFLIREHRAELSAKELSQIRADHYDPIRHLNWITPRLKEALQNNDRAVVSDLQAEIKGIELSVTSIGQESPETNKNCETPSLSRTKQKRVKKSDPIDRPERPSIAELQNDLPEE
jgi:hypothetical protein